MVLFKYNVVRTLLSAEKLSVTKCQIAGVKSYEPIKTRTDIEWPEKSKLTVMPKVPQYGPSMRPFKMQKRLKYMRGPELLHNELIHRQFGVVAELGGRLKSAHFEVIRMTLLRRCDFTKMFAIWRVDPPWQPLTKKGLGQKMGGGKGAIDQYVTPIKSGRVIFEVGGNIEYFEVERVLRVIANKMPFKAKAVSYEIMEQERKKSEMMEKNNLNPWTWEYVINNNLGGCWNWISPVDKMWYNKYK